MAGSQISGSGLEGLSETSELADGSSVSGAAVWQAGSGPFLDDGFDRYWGRSDRR